MHYPGYKPGKHKYKKYKHKGWGKHKKHKGYGRKFKW
jgi:hypothetical protein